MRDDPLLNEHRQFIRMLWAACIAFLVWAYFAELDFVVSTQGGLVQGAFVNAEGAVVPKGDALHMEGWVRNEDAAAVVPGLAALVRVAVYPQGNGWIEGEVARGWIDDKTRELRRNAKDEPPVYRISFTLKRQSLSLGGQDYELKAGMSAVGVVQLGKRTVLDYLTSPVRKVLHEAALGR